jgi:hypothetical protein
MDEGSNGGSEDVLPAQVKWSGICTREKRSSAYTLTHEQLVRYALISCRNLRLPS